MNKRNAGALVCGLIGAIFALFGGLMWSACAESCAGFGMEVGVYYMAGFLGLGVGGAVLGLIGAILAFGYKKGGRALLIIGLLCQIGLLVVACIFYQGFSFIMNVSTIIAIILFLIAAILAHGPSSYSV